MVNPKLNKVIQANYKMSKLCVIGQHENDVKQFKKNRQNCKSKNTTASGGSDAVNHNADNDEGSTSQVKLMSRRIIQKVQKLHNSWSQSK